MNKVLLVIDMQNDFVGGVLGSAEARSITGSVEALVQEYKKQGFPVLFTMDTHQEGDYGSAPSSVEAQRIPPHCIAGTEGWQIIGLLRPYAENFIIEKPSFMSLSLQEQLGKMDDHPLAIGLCGVCTDICVVSNALYLRALYPDSDIAVYSGCCAGTTPENHRAALQVMKSCLIDIR